MKTGERKGGFLSKGMKKIWSSSLHAIYPELCLICQSELSEGESSICPLCFSDLDFTNFENFNESTPLDQLFWGRVQLSYSYTLLYYSKTNPSKKLLSALKYEHRQEVGEKFGRMIGEKLRDREELKDLDCLIPVPLHPKKEFLRGYNQSEMLAKGMSLSLHIPYYTNYLKRNEHSKSQTSLGRFKRWDNVQEKFDFNSSLLKFKHIALVDDVITTGSTLESIVQKIQERNPSIKISLLSLALAK